MQRIKGKILGILLIAAIGGLSFSLVSYFANPPLEKQLSKIASDLNAQCPIMVDSETRLDNAISTEYKTFQYNYTLVNLRKDELDVQKLTDNIKPGILRTIQTSPQLSFFRENNITMSYLYKDKDGVFVMKINFAPDDYMH